MRRHIVFSVAALIAVLATPGCQESTTTPPEFKDDAEAPSEVSRATGHEVRRLAFEENTKMHTLLMEGLDRVFKDRGLPSIAELTDKKH